MNLKDMFRHQTVSWATWADFIVIEREGVRYLAPEPSAMKMIYNCAQEPGELVADALELGRRLTLDTPEKDSLCAAFAARYGLLGLEQGNDTTPSKEADLQPSSRILGSDEYGEDLEQFQKAFKTLYRHFDAVGKMGAERPKYSAETLTGSLSFRLTGGAIPHFAWKIPSLQSFIHFCYSVLISSDRHSLKACKNCGRVYYNSNPKSEFCGTKCRNYFNVKAFRDRE